MAEKTDTVPPVAAKTTKSPGATPEGVIVFNPNLCVWRCVSAAGREVLSCASKAYAMRMYPTFIVKEK
jgi:hypothetical protein